MNAALKRLLLALVAIAVVLNLAEGALYYFIHHPAHIPERLLRKFSSLYWLFNDMIQVNGKSAIYDPELTYTLRPGTFTFSNLEFSNRFAVNHLGLRDSEEALKAPSVIVLGDSYAMGWGVEQDEAFPKRLEKLTGCRVLNAGVSSYGTAREMKMLDRLDVSQLRYLIIQYADNDTRENAAFATNKNRFQPKTSDRYAVAVKKATVGRRYVWGKYLHALYQIAVEPTPYDAEREKFDPPKLFLNALAHGSKQDLSRVQIIVLSAIGPASFLPDVRSHLRNAGLPPALATLKAIDLPPFTADDYHRLDRHWRPEWARQGGVRARVRHHALFAISC